MFKSISLAFNCQQIKCSLSEVKGPQSGENVGDSVSDFQLSFGAPNRKKHLFFMGIVKLCTGLCLQVLKFDCFCLVRLYNL